jgi:hypothetical protein
VIRARANTVVVIAAENLGPLASISTGDFSFTTFDIYFSFKKLVGYFKILKLKLFKLIPDTYNL